MNGFSVTAILPTLNEAENLPTVLPAVAHSLAGVCDRYEVLVVDDASSDGTVDVARQVRDAGRLPVRILKRRCARDLSTAVVFGASRATTEWVIVLDADASHDPRSIPRILEPLRQGIEISVGSRHVDRGHIVDWPMRRRVASALATRVARLFCSVRDPMSGLFATRRDLLLSESLRPRGFKILLELLARHTDASVIEVPIRFRDRANGESKMCLRQVRSFGHQIVLLGYSRLIRWLRRPFSRP